ncbi:putative phage abortive infection protein [Pseudoalteromonas sp. L1]|uniref:putative phage abortive infection protein n=1 Tax=Pseudoalteromonas sp. L1 TaxID=195716 RepID=UPI001F40C2BE|nr:putative phage abortive infection protein [Pseudoalteromonas sp. L1]
MKRMIIIIFCLAAVAAVTALGLYAIKFGFGFASTIGDWGSVGDFFGGVLNPTFALLSLILIAYTLMQNKKALEQSEQAIKQGTEAIEQNEKALRVSNEELKLTRDELANSSEALKEQANLLAVQSFETTFFNMLELHNKLLKNIDYDINESYHEISSIIGINGFTDYGRRDLNQKGTNALNRILNSISSVQQRNQQYESLIISVFDAFYTYKNKDFGSYFRNLYQILKLIENSFSNKHLQKKYSNILRAQLSNQELSLLLLNCLCSYVDNGQFKKLVIHFELLEHLDITYNLDNNNIVTFIINNPTLYLTSDEIDQYLSTDSSGKLIKSAFGQNLQILEYCKFRNMVDQ